MIIDHKDGKASDHLGRKSPRLMTNPAVTLLLSYSARNAAAGLVAAARRAGSHEAASRTSPSIQRRPRTPPRPTAALPHQQPADADGRPRGQQHADTPSGRSHAGAPGAASAPALAAVAPERHPDRDLPRSLHGLKRHQPVETQRGQQHPDGAHRAGNGGSEPLRRPDRCAVASSNDWLVITGRFGSTSAIARVTSADTWRPGACSHVQVQLGHRLLGQRHVDEGNGRSPALGSSRCGRRRRW